MFTDELLSGNTRVDALIECAVLSLVCSQILLVLLEHFLIILGESRDLVNVLDRLVWPVRGDLTRGAWIHSPVRIKMGMSGKGKVREQERALT